MKLEITDKASHFSLDLIDNNCDKPVKSEVSFHKQQAELRAQSIIAEQIAIAEGNGDEIAEIPVIWHTPVTILQRLLFCLEESHQEEIENNHYGDSSCSYCREITRAKQMLDYHGLKPLTDLTVL